MAEQINVKTKGQGLHEVTEQVQRVVHGSEVRNGICVVFIQHTSASLIIQENADPSAAHDLEQWMNRLVRERDPHFTHVYEGPDDMPSHIKSALTSCSLSIPIIDGRLALGTWQGIYLWEHRVRPHTRHLIVQVVGV